MLFNSIQYAIFLPLIFAIYWLLPHRFRWILLLLSSYYFYMSWKAHYVILILFTTAVSYGTAIVLENQTKAKNRKIILVVASVLCLAVLFAFKYFNFFFETIDGIFSYFAIPIHPMLLKFALPVGISFYTFQTLGYVIDVYRKEIPAEHHFGIYALYVSFFPQLVAGPIERAGRLIPQLHCPLLFDAELATAGARQILLGYYKKLVIADNLAIYVDKVYSDLARVTGCDLCIAVFFFTIQIYCDFSGYSDIAIGSAKLLGIKLSDNFKAPYFSGSVREFWGRWHISLSQWFRDYVYIPLGGNRCSVARRNFNMLITFLLSGLWHGAKWSFVAWGGVHGIAQILENTADGGLKKVRDNKFGRCVCTLLVFIFCNLTWVLFRGSTYDAWYIYTHMLEGLFDGRFFSDVTVIETFTLGILIFHILILAFYDYMCYTGKIETLMRRRWLRWGTCIAIGVFIAIFSQKGLPAEFVYFQF